MTWTLAIDTSHFVSVGLAHDGKPVGKREVADTRAHVEELMPATMSLLEEHGLALSDVESIVVGMGPGPFTGLRVGIATAETLAAMSRATLRRVCSLDVIAQQWEAAPVEFIAASDARRKELYWAHYVEGIRQGEPRVSAPREMLPLPVCGHVPPEYRDSVPVEASIDLDPARMAADAESLPAASAEPYYLRPADATVGSGPKSALPRLRAKR